MARASARARRADDDDDKYAKASSARGVAAASTRAPAFASPPTHRPSAKMFDDDDVAPRSVSARATPARDDGDDGDRRDASARPARLNFDDEGVRGALDRLAFSNSVARVTDAFGEVLNDASDEVNTYASKAAETLARFQAAQFAMQFNPIESGLSMKPTYVKVPAQTVEELKFWENEDLRALKMKHLEEKQQILAENAGMRALLGDEDFSEAIQGLRETEDGVNRALLLAAVEEITNLKTRVSVLETEAAKQKVSSSGYGGITSMLGGGGSGVDAAQMQKLTRELARLEENNSRMTWMLGEKEKQIKEVRAKYTESAAYALQEKLQECMEVLEVASNLQGEQLQYLEQHALSKLELLDDQIADIQVLAESKTEHLAQLRTIMKRFFVDGDEGSVDVLTSLTGFPADEGRKLVQARQSRSLTGFLTMIGTKLTPAVNAGVSAVNAASSMIVACAPPTSSATSSDDALKTLGVEDDDESAEQPTTPPAPEETSAPEKDAPKERAPAPAPPTNEVTAIAPKVEPERRRPSRAAKKKSTGFAGFDDPALEAKAQAERAKSRQPLPQPKLTKAAARERAKRAHPPQDAPGEGFAGFGDDPDASSDDDSSTRNV